LLASALRIQRFPCTRDHFNAQDQRLSLGNQRIDDCAPLPRLPREAAVAQAVRVAGLAAAFAPFIRT